MEETVKSNKQKSTSKQQPTCGDNPQPSHLRNQNAEQLQKSSLVEMHSLDRSAALPVLLEPSTYTMTQKTA
jgi:hypothetical protein